MRYAIVNVSTADLRRRPDHRSEMVSQGLLGAVLRVSGPSVGDGWLKVVLPDGYTGWMRSWNLVKVSKRAAREWSERATATVVSGCADVLLSRRRGSHRIRDLVLGCRVIPVRRERTWTRVELPDGRGGWVRAGALAAGTGPSVRGGRRVAGGGARPADRAAIVRTARLFLGAPYLWGGVSPKGADCSGLVQTVFAVHGIPLPRDVADQCRCGKRVSKEDIEAGDLLFFGPAGRRPTHVGVSTGGTGFIHAGCPIHEADLGRRSGAASRRGVPPLRFAMRVLP